MKEDGSPQLSVDEIYRMLRSSMGHTWPIGTFGPKPERDIIEGEFRVVEPRKDLKAKLRQLPQGE